ncbi:YDG/SRA domain-containing protein [Colletotrichum scovillei]|uniref:YDG/SRA domain-containing protein n=1 Tax=Colletotrichum scovillei TaxID=1209932 RepID=A0A9P7QSL9_9PEZI|nr:YDG/SRA domain-containing protein [Colletotrichum scovillei]KAG7041792.1 YDG/SRA domain-containing protein [Colletotrichum scovillei]KAG7061823.1 YDG/SRA domain-containing protein [Colletotrichum scovillei]
MDFPFGQDEQGNPFPDPDPANILGPNPDEGWPKDEHPQHGNRQVIGGFLEDLPDLDDLDAHLGDPSSFASTGPEQSIEFHTSFEGMPPNGPADQGLGPTALPEIGQANNSNDLGFQDGVTNAAPPLAYGPATGHTAMWIFYAAKHSSSSPLATRLTATLLDKTRRT